MTEMYKLTEEEIEKNNLTKKEIESINQWLENNLPLWYINPEEYRMINTDFFHNSDENEIDRDLLINLKIIKNDIIKKLIKMEIDHSIRALDYDQFYEEGLWNKVLVNQYKNYKGLSEWRDIADLIEKESKEKELIYLKKDIDFIEKIRIDNSPMLSEEQPTWFHVSNGIYNLLIKSRRGTMKSITEEFIIFCNLAIEYSEKNETIDEWGNLLKLQKNKPKWLTVPLYENKKGDYIFTIANRRDFNEFIKNNWGMSSIVNKVQEGLEDKSLIEYKPVNVGGKISRSIYIKKKLLM